MTKAVVNVPSPRPHVFSILTDYPRYKEWVPGCESSEVTGKSGAATDAQIIINGMKRMELGLRFESQGTQSINFHMISGKDLKSYTGSYRLMDSADGKGTVLVAELDVDVGGMVPKFMVDRFIGKSFDETGKALTAYAKKLPVQVEAAARGPVAEAKPRRAKRVLQIVKTAGGYNVWLLGEAFAVKR
jgi:ribosome-associated toxin RatA of RatAB toxin-antitoxin module